jgi:hypothetical protein
VTGPVTVRLLAEPSSLTLDERATFRLGVTATNEGDEAVDPGLFGLVLLVDGERSPAFDLAVGNGVVPAGWDRLDAGASTTPVHWPLGEALFPAPGEYHLALQLGEDEQSTATVVVTP